MILLIRWCLDYEMHVMPEDLVGLSIVGWDIVALLAELLASLP